MGFREMFGVVVSQVFFDWDVAFVLVCCLFLANKSLFTKKKNNCKKLNANVGCLELLEVATSHVALGR